MSNAFVKFSNFKFQTRLSNPISYIAYHKSISGIEYPVFFYIIGAITSATTDINFINIFNDGPAVSLKGSPTVSPTTAAL